jgi:hypothetical protein
MYFMWEFIFYQLFHVFHPVLPEFHHCMKHGDVMSSPVHRGCTIVRKTVVLGKEVVTDNCEQLALRTPMQALVMAGHLSFGASASPARNPSIWVPASISPE